jgi:hypothetical protein
LSRVEGNMVRDQTKTRLWVSNSKLRTVSSLYHASSGETAIALELREHSLEPRHISMSHG